MINKRIASRATCPKCAANLTGISTFAHFRIAHPEYKFKHVRLMCKHSKKSMIQCRECKVLFQTYKKLIAHECGEQPAPRLSVAKIKAEVKNRNESVFTIADMIMQLNTALSQSLAREEELKKRILSLEKRLKDEGKNSESLAQSLVAANETLAKIK